MHRRWRVMLPLAVALFIGASRAEAASIEIEDVFDPQDVLFRKQSSASCVGDTATDTIVIPDDTACSSLQFTYALSTDSLTAATLELHVRDDDDPGKNPETLRLTLNDGLVGEYSIAGSPFHVDVLATITANGLLNILLDRGTQGAGQADFYFDKSILRAAWQQDDTAGLEAVTAPVPEPAALLLVGAGVAATARRWRRFMSSRQ